MDNKTSVKITIELNESEKLIYFLTDKVVSALVEGDNCLFEFCLPSHGNIAIARIIKK